MSVRKLSAAEAEALLSSLAERDCGENCQCVFCRTFEEGRQSGLADAAITFRRALEDFTRRAA